MIDNVELGRQRQNEIADKLIKYYKLSDDEIEPIYGYSEGYGYCGIKILNPEIAITSRTSSKNTITVDYRLLDTNISNCEEMGVLHNLVLCFNWNTTKDMFLIKDTKCLTKVVFNILKCKRVYFNIHTIEDYIKYNLKCDIIKIN